MNTKDFLRLGIPLGEATRRATDFVSQFILSGGDKTRLEEELKAIIANPSAFVRDDLRGELAKALLNAPPPPRAEPVKYRQWGEGLEHEAVMQMEKACLLPVAVAGALMPDAHVGYGLPIGGVLATENTVIPYAVGVDIACRMKMTVLDVPLRELERHPERLTRAIEAETRFGVGATFKNRRHHEVLDADWDVSPVTKRNKDRAWSQLGTSGSGNHFVEFGIFTAHGPIGYGVPASAGAVGSEGERARPAEAGTPYLPPGQYLALLSHSGSRGTGAAVCDHYSRLAFSQFPDLPSELRVLRPGGHFLLIDGTVPDDDPETEEWLHRVEKWRDPSHGRFLSRKAWQDLAEKAGLKVARSDLQSRKQPDLNWYFDTAATSEEHREKVLEAVAKASEHVKAALRLGNEDGKIVWWWPMLALLARKTSVGR